MILDGTGSSVTVRSGQAMQGRNGWLGLSRAQSWISGRILADSRPPCFGEFDESLSESQPREIAERHEVDSSDRPRVETGGRRPAVG